MAPENPGPFVCHDIDESAGLAQPAPLATYTLTLHGPTTTPWGYPPDRWDIEPFILKETEQNITDLLPDGYSVKIERWDA